MFYLVPFCGGLVVVVWYYVALIVGLKEAHEIPAWKAAVASLIWLVLCCAFCGVLFFWIASMVSGAGVNWLEELRKMAESAKGF
ncbi:MAG: hypothetical protein HC901_01325 [Bdellovibrionaceae bacterium]|nr:hypothetical protein [Pseudobdellovibrionaceae bacterium]